MLEGLNQLQDAIDSGSSIEKELSELLSAKTSEELLSIAYRIRAKMEVRNDIVCDLTKVINTMKNA